MEKFANLLERFKKITLPDGVLRKEVSFVIKEKTGIEVPVEKISISRNVVYIDENGIKKASIFLKKTTILKELEKEFKKQTPTDLR